jgi:hypothetical protein
MTKRPNRGQRKAKRVSLTSLRSPKRMTPVRRRAKPKARTKTKPISSPPRT